jgi:predicted RNA binding protein YcfA (HicA-like mRNA interferase family)
MAKPRLPRGLSGDDVKRALEKAGLKKVSQKGSHMKLKHEDGRVVIVPMHLQLATGTLRSILRQSKLALEEFVKLLK